MREVGRALDADYVVEGSVRRAGDRIRITAQLINAGTGAHLWLIDTIAPSTTCLRSKMRSRVRWWPRSRSALRRRPRLWRGGARRRTCAPTTCSCGRTVSRHEFTDEGQARARAFYEKARALDPTFARAYTGLAYNCLNRSMDHGVGVPREKDLDRIEARRSAEQALVVDPTEPRVQSTAGYIFLTWREFDRAKRHFDLARTMNPNDATIQIFWAWAQACLGVQRRSSRPQNSLCGEPETSTLVQLL